MKRKQSNFKCFKKLSISLVLFTSTFSSYSQSLDSSKIADLSELVVKATRVNEKSGMAYSDVFQKDLRKQNLGQDLPFLLNQLPSVVVSSDAGAGIGYTGIRIRGTDPTRINVTLNGIPYNDSESQGVYWVNMPDFASSVQSIQVQRGVGTSTNGAGAFGGSINVNTLQLNREAYGEANVSAGSFNTTKVNLLVSTGLINDRFVFDARLSRITSDGFVDRASSNLQSFYVSGGYYKKNSFIRLNVFSGNERTYQSWNGIPQALAKSDSKGIEDFISRNFYDENFKNEILKSGRKYNFYSYDNEVDDYKQSHIQLISSLQVAKNWRFNPTLHYTKGMGFYEQFKSNQKLVNYGLANVTVGNSIIKRTDLIRRKWLDNDFYGAVWSLDYEGTGKIKGNLGGGWNQYLGEHFGEVIWAKNASNGNIRHRYYENNTNKNDFNMYAKLFYSISKKLDVFLDLQVRKVSFDMLGTGDEVGVLDYGKSYTFFNPKFGFNYQFTNNSSFYSSYAKGSKEPSRQDFVDNAPKVPNPELLHDFEMGYRITTRNWKAEANLYYMNYVNQLVLTGQVNLTGDAIRLNVDKSYRAGIELQVSKKVSEKFNLALNTTFSRNRIKDFDEVVPSYGNLPNEVNSLKNTNISFSPNVISGGSVNFLPTKKIEISLLPKYVGKQFLDNTSSESKKLDAYFVNDLRLTYHIKAKTRNEIDFSILINNMFNKKFESNGYTYSYLTDIKIVENFVFPQAGTNVLAGFRVRF